MTNAAYARHARTLTFNKGNWSGESITIEVRRGNKFTLHGESFRLLDVTKKDQGDARPGDKFYRLDIIGDGWDHPLGCVMWFDGDDTKTATNDIGGCGLTRDAQDPVECAVQLLCNIL